MRQFTRIVFQQTTHLCVIAAQYRHSCLLIAYGTTLSASQPKQCQMSGLVDDKLGKMWRGPVVVQFEVICWHRTGAAEENHKEIQFSRCPGRDSNRTAFERIFRHTWNQIPEVTFRNFQTASVVPSFLRLAGSL